MKQLLGGKKHRLCEKKANKKYLACYVRGGDLFGGHFWAQCWFSPRDADFVNYKTGEIRPLIRNGSYVKEDAT